MSNALRIKLDFTVVFDRDISINEEIVAMPMAVHVGKAMAHLGAVEITEAKRTVEVRDWKARVKAMRKKKS